MIETSRKKVVVAACLVCLALFSFSVLPLIAYAAEAEAKNSRILRARGIAIERAEEGATNSLVNMTLILEPGTITRRVIAFSVISGEMEVDGNKYMVTEGRGVVAYHNRTMAMRLSATSPDGDPVVVKMVGRYFWMWGRLHVARLVGVLEQSGCKIGLLLRAAIRPEQ